MHLKIVPFFQQDILMIYFVFFLGLWIIEDRFRHQPKITFKKELLFLLYTTTGSTQSYVTYSTFENYNKLQQNFLRIPLIKVRQLIY